MKIGLMHDVIDEVCPIHQVYLWQSKTKVKSANNQVPHYIKMCPECVRAKTEAQQAQAIGDALIQEKLATSYDVFERDSMIPAELKGASYKTFTVGSDVDQQAKNFAMRLNRFYFKEEGKGNALIVGQSGIGKSHLTVSIARKLNDDWKSINEPKSVLFVSVSKLFQRIQDGFNTRDGVSREQMMKLLVSVDYLFLDDLGKESTYGQAVKEANNWKQEFLYQLLDERETTIINTNLEGTELVRVYDKALVSRILKGSKNNIFKYPKGAEDRRKLPF